MGSKVRQLVHRPRLRVGIQRWKLSSFVFFLGLGILLCSVVYVLWPDKVFSLYIPREKAPEEMKLGEEKKMLLPMDYPLNEEVLRFDMAPRDWERGAERHLYIQAHPGDYYETDLHIDAIGNVYDPGTGDYQGYQWVLLGLAIFFMASAASSLLEFILVARENYYSYRNVFRAGMSLFLLCIGIIFLVQWGRLLQNPAGVHRRDILNLLAGSGYQFIRFTQPLVFLFSIALSVSNVALLRREGHRFQNILGILLGACLLLGMGLGYLLKEKGGPSISYQVFFSVYATGFAYFECLLLGTIFSALLAVHHVPSMGRDYLVILGCGFAPDGSLYPLLRGRVDKAIDYWRTQFLKTGKRAIFVPSGGQGKGESMAEAKAMTNYLLSQGFHTEDILPEDKSVNTYENMKFSRALIEKENPTASSLFVTTNYHLFRAGILAREVGFSADGLGSRTKWYFWPNAFVREFIGLLKGQLIRILSVLLFLTLAFIFIRMNCR